MPSVKNLRAFVYQPFCGAGFSVVEGVAPHQLFMQGPQPQRLDPLGLGSMNTCGKWQKRGVTASNLNKSGG